MFCSITGVACSLPCILRRLSGRPGCCFDAAAELSDSGDKLVHTGFHSGSTRRELSCGGCDIRITFRTSVFRQEQTACKSIHSVHIGRDSLLFICKLRCAVSQCLDTVRSAVEAAACSCHTACIGTDAVADHLQPGLHALDSASQCILTCSGAF